MEATDLRVRRYDGGTAGGRPVLLVPAPIKRGYIFDLLPAVSVVQRALEAGFSLHSIEWRENASGDLDTTSDSLRAALDQITEEKGQPPAVIAHSLGGTIAAITAAMYPDLLKKLVLIQSPLAFGEKTGTLRPIVQYSKMMLRRGEVRGQIPGSLLDLGSIGAAPDEFVLGRWIDAWSSLPDIDALSIHARVVRWSLDEFAPSAPLIEAVLELLYSRDLFARDKLHLLGRHASLRALHTVPAAVIVDPTSRLIPPSSTLQPLRSPKVFVYEPETGVAFQHVGPIVGRRALQDIWPSIVQWINQRASPCGI
jgi:polyhydroxyalkanoate synthase